MAQQHADAHIEDANISPVNGQLEIIDGALNQKKLGIRGRYPAPEIVIPREQMEDIRNSLLQTMQLEDALRKVEDQAREINELKHLLALSKSATSDMAVELQKHRAGSITEEVEVLHQKRTIDHLELKLVGTTERLNESTKKQKTGVNKIRKLEKEFKEQKHKNTNLQSAYDQLLGKYQSTSKKLKDIHQNSAE